MKMRRKYESELKPLEIEEPEGMTVSVGEAARILGTSRSTLKRRSHEWGLRTFWDRRGRRYSVGELKKAREGVLKPRKPANLTLDIDSIRNYNCAIRRHIGHFCESRYEKISK